MTYPDFSLEALPDPQRLALIECDIERGKQKQRKIRLERNSPQYRAADTRKAKA